MSDLSSNASVAKQPCLPERAWPRFFPKLHRQQPLYGFRKSSTASRFSIWPGKRPRLSLLRPSVFTSRLSDVEPPSPSAITRSTSGHPSMTASTSPSRFDALVISPNNLAKALFDIFVALCVLYTAITIPLKVTFQTDFLPRIDIFLDALFVLDVLLQFLHGYMHDGFPVSSLRRIAHRYVTTWFVVDFIASIPLDRLLGVLSAVQLIKTARLLRISRLLRRWNGFSSGNVLRVVLILVLWLLVAHFMGCGFFALGWNLCPIAADNAKASAATFTSGTLANVNDTWGETGNGVGEGGGRSPQNWTAPARLVASEWRHAAFEATWVSKYWPQLREACEAGVRPGEAAAIVPITSMYVRSLYFGLSTMTSLGYGDGPVASNDVEHLYAIAAQVVGACLAAAIFSNIAQLINKGDARSARYEAQADKINEFIRFHKMPPGLQSKLRAYNDLNFSINRGFDMAQISKGFPKNLQEDIFFELHAKVVRQVTIFKHCDDAFIKALVPNLQPQVLLSGDYVFRGGDAGDTMYFIQHGTIDVVSNDGKTCYKTLRPGDYFGELAMFTQSKRTAGARASSDCILYFLVFPDFERVIAFYPQLYNTILEAAMEQLVKTLENNKSLENRLAHLRLKKAMHRAKLAASGLVTPQPPNGKVQRRHEGPHAARERAKARADRAKRAASSEAAKRENGAGRGGGASAEDGGEAGVSEAGDSFSQDQSFGSTAPEAERAGLRHWGFVREGVRTEKREAAFCGVASLLLQRVAAAAREPTRVVPIDANSSGAEGVALSSVATTAADFKSTCTKRCADGSRVTQPCLAFTGIEPQRQSDGTPMNTAHVVTSNETLLQKGKEIAAHAHKTAPLGVRGVDASWQQAERGNPEVQRPVHLPEAFAAKRDALSHSHPACASRCDASIRTDGDSVADAVEIGARLSNGRLLSARSGKNTLAEEICSAGGVSIDAAEGKPSDAGEAASSSAKNKPCSEASFGLPGRGDSGANLVISAGVRSRDEAWLIDSARSRSSSDALQPPTQQPSLETEQPSLETEQPSPSPRHNCVRFKTRAGA